VLDPASRASLAATDQPLATARTLPRVVLTDPAVLAVEQRALFARSWLAVAREEDLPDPGSFVTRDIGAERILVVRDDHGALHASFNVCRHRGSRIVDAPAGRLRGAIACPYHAWTYALDGRLQRVPQMPADWSVDGLSLTPVRVDRHAGFVFVNLEAEAPARAMAHADLPDLGRYRADALRRVHKVEYEVAANWKIVVENYSECYHCPLVHPQLARISDLMSGGFEQGRCFNGGPMALRDGVQTMSMTGASPSGPMPGLADDLRGLVHYYVVYPNLMLGLHPDYMLVHQAWPLAVDRTQVTCEWFFPPASDGADPLEAQGVYDFWDVTNRQDWALCERVQAGALSRGYSEGPYHPSERCVHAFDAWYARWLLDATKET